MLFDFDKLLGESKEYVTFSAMFGPDVPDYDRLFGLFTGEKAPLVEVYASEIAGEDVLAGGWKSYYFCNRKEKDGELLFADANLDRQQVSEKLIEQVWELHEMGPSELSIGVYRTADAEDCYLDIYVSYFEDKVTVFYDKHFFSKKQIKEAFKDCFKEA